MPNNPPDDRPRKKGPSRSGPRRTGPRRNGGTPDNRPQQSRAPGERQHQPRSGRLSREELEWARDLWQHGEPPDEIANQLGIDVAQAEELVAGWTR
jgi:hypothetical protein